MQIVRVRKRLQMIALKRNEAITLARGCKVALAAAVDHGPAVAAACILLQSAFDERARKVATVGVEANQGESQRRRYGRSHRLGKAEPLLMNGAEGRDEGSLLRTLTDLRLACDQPSQILVAELARQQQQCEDTEAEGGPKAALRPSM